MNKYILSIGAGENQLPVIVAAKNLGYKTISVDKNPNAIGHKNSDIQIYQFILDKELIIENLNKLNLNQSIKAVCCRSYRGATLTAAYIAEKLKLNTISADAVQKFFNKKIMKKIVSNHEVKVPKSYNWETKEMLYNILNTIKYPCIIKPTNAESKKGIQLIHDRLELKKFLDAHFPDDKSYLLEEFVEGLEFTVLGFVSESSFHLVSISDKITTKFHPFIEISHRLPFSKMDFKKEIESICYKIVKSMNMKYCPFVGEFRITESGEIYFIEAMPEVGGEYLADYLIPLHYQYDYFMNYIQLMLGEAIQKNNIQKNENLKTHIFFATPPEGTSKLIKSNNIMNFEDSLIFLSKDLKKEGDILDSTLGNLTRVKVVGIKHWGKLNKENLDEELNRRLGVQFERVD